MEDCHKLKPVTAAHKFIDYYFPDCDGALLAGSVVRGEATETSDLDIIVFDETVESSYRESLINSGWRIEVFVHNLDSYQDFFCSDYKRARPSLPRMVSEGVVLRDTGILDSIRNEANQLLAEGPEEWSSETIDTKRYFITDALDDFIGCNNRSEAIFIAGTLAELVSEFVLRTNKRWIGASKWIIRSLRDYDKNFAEQFAEAFDEFYKNDDKTDVIRIVDRVLDPYGGRLFEGFLIGKK
ncbi:nucleotidyltransferase domain-containing protein [Evansella sp. LMS18]|uniref:nucleotidyltransferase domain-containing protein n=1 Tax=Evansella sp. LMS18 TaxID=2924033 RepID=UPI0020D1AFDF|nr:nucleotidyltransferase domain-containing protein [Evansella sp. LMS18]UTR10074.1 nucleotidyltransferase domain-containing protein [Evansella sp. LMS18]